jgi:hypothetical protein
MALEILFNGSHDSKTRSQIEADKFMKRLFDHNEDIGAISSLTTGQPGSCKTAAMCAMCEHAMFTHPNDKIFWRSALNAPIQVFKLPKWHIFIQNGSGIRLFDRITGKDITDRLISEKGITYFSTLDELYDIAKPGCCNGVFFRDLYKSNVAKDQGTIMWFRFIRFLLHKYAWNYVFIDEYQELVKAGSKGGLYWEIDEHANDVSNARKSNVALHVNCHQLQEIDYRPKNEFMLLNQMYGSIKDKHSPVSKKALGSIPRPTEAKGADAWISEGGNYGHITYEKVYKLPKHLSVEARIVEAYEDIVRCSYCNRKYIEDDSIDGFCSVYCRNNAKKAEK